MKFVIDSETNGLNSIEHRITCISILNIDTKEVQSFFGEDEKKILEQFFNSIENVDELIGFNSNSFDIPFIIKRAIINKVRLPQYWKQIKHTDLRKVVNSFFISYNAKEHGTLNQWGVILGCGEKESNGLECVEAYNRKDWKFIKEHCEFDCMITKALLIRCKECNVL